MGKYSMFNVHGFMYHTLFTLFLFAQFLLHVFKTKIEVKLIMKIGLSYVKKCWFIYFICHWMDV